MTDILKKYDLNCWNLSVLTILFTLIFTGCRDSSVAPADIDPSMRPVIIRLDSILSAKDIPDAITPEVAAGLRRYASVTLVDTIPESITDYALRLASSEGIRVFAPDVNARFNGLTDFSDAYAVANRIAKEQLPDLNFPDTVYAVISPYRQQVFMIDSVMFVATNHFLGSGYPGYDGFSNSERLRREPTRMAPAVTEAIIRSENHDIPSNALAAMAFEGAVYYSLHQLFPSLPDSTLLGIPDDDIRWLDSRGQQLINSLAASEMLFSSDLSVASRIIDSPVTITLPDIVLPPHTGRYIGYRLVSAIASQNTEPTLTHFLSGSFYNDPALLQSAPSAFSQRRHPLNSL